MHEWEVTLVNGQTPHVHADGWQVNANGDLAFINKGEFVGADLFFVRAYAAGTWQEVSLFA